MQQWERGRNRPNLTAVAKLRDLASDEEMRAKFSLDIAESTSKINSTSVPELPIDNKEQAPPGGVRSNGRIVPKHYRPAPKPRR